MLLLTTIAPVAERRVLEYVDLTCGKPSLKHADSGQMNQIKKYLTLIVFSPGWPYTAV